MAGERLRDDPVWVDVSVFLADLEAVYPPNPKPRDRDGHLAAIARETRRVRTARARAAPPARRPRLHLLAAWVVATLLAATAAVGIAGAAGRGPLARLAHPFPAASLPAQSPDPGTAPRPPSAAAGTAPSDSRPRIATNPDRQNLGRDAATGPVRTAAPATRRPSTPARGVAVEKWAEGKPGKGQPGVPGRDPIRPAVRPEKPGQGLPGVPGNGEHGAAATGADKPGKGRTGVPGTDHAVDRKAGEG